MITAGIDSGAKNTKAVILKNGKVLGKGMAPTGFDPVNAARRAFEGALAEAGLRPEAVERIAATGSGKEVLDFAHVKVNEIEAMAKAARCFFADARTVVDVGAEEGRAVALDEKGALVDFVINEKCAAGAGAFIEAMARALEVSVEEMGALCLQSDIKIPLNAQCVIFAESEVVGLIHARTPKAHISKAIHDAVAGRIVSMVRRVGIRPEVVLLGGVAQNPGFVKAVQKELQLERLLIPQNPEFGPAQGAALAAAQEG